MIKRTTHTDGDGTDSMQKAMPHIAISPSDLIVPAVSRPQVKKPRQCVRPNQPVVSINKISNIVAQIVIHDASEVYMYNVCTT